MAEICSCKEGSFNTGQPNCVDIFDRAKYIVLVRTRDNSGALNAIANNAVLDQSYLDTKVNETPDKRWYVFPNHIEFTDEREDPNTEDIEGIAYYASEGTRTINLFYQNKLGSPDMKKVIDSHKCFDNAVFIITHSNQIVGYQPQGVDDLLPMPIQTGTLWSKFIQRTKTTTNRVQMSWIVAESLNDGDLSFIPADAITGSLATLKGISDITLTPTTPQTVATTLVVQAQYTNFGTAFEKQPLLGVITVGDWDVFNETTSLAIVPSGVVETTPGVYTFTIAAQTASDVIRVELDKDGFEANSVTITAI
jgi:hypothetical protein